MDENILVQPTLLSPTLCWGMGRWSGAGLGDGAEGGGGRSGDWR